MTLEEKEIIEIGDSRHENTFYDLKDLLFLSLQTITPPSCTDSKPGWSSCFFWGMPVTNPGTIPKQGPLFQTLQVPSPGDAFEVIYALSLPTDVALLFEETGTGFNPELLLPLDRIQFYDDPGQVALLMEHLA